jgi:hypothetical protein
VKSLKIIVFELDFSLRVNFKKLTKMECQNRSMPGISVLQPDCFMCFIHVAFHYAECGQIFV